MSGNNLKNNNVNFKDDIKLEDVKLTPWLEQYKKFKEQYKDELLLFRMGDFYELFFEDAKKAAAVLDIALTARDKEKKIPMAGIPYHALNIYLGRLIKAGYRAAICEQVGEVASKNSGAKIVDRKVIRVVTPGTYIPDEQDDNNNARLAAVNIYKNKIALAFLNVETGKLEAGTLIKSEAGALISAFKPSEVICPSSLQTQKILDSLPVLANYELRAVKSELFKLDSAVSRLEAALKNKKLSSFGFDERDACIGSAWAALDYLSATQFSSVRHVLNIRPLSLKDRMNLDETAQVNLDLINSEASLFNCLDKCKSPMGRRTLREWLLKPLMDLSAIKRRQDAIGELIDAPENIEPLQDLLAAARDIERALSRLALGSGTPRDLAAIRDTLKLLPEFLNFKVLRSLIDAFPAERLKDLLNYLDAALEEDLPRALNLKPVIKSSFNKELASWRDIQDKGEEWLNEYLERERVNTQSPRLKAGYTQAFGYYLEIGKAGLVKTPEYFERRQTLVNSQRYTTPQLRDFQDKMLHSTEEIERIEQLIYQQVINQVIDFSAELQMAGRLLGLLDCVASGAAIARERSYVKPEVDNSLGIYIKAGRHPVLEAVMTDRVFIPNDIILGEDNARIIILTGPNMAGKSTWLRTAALLAIMAQAGLWIPAQSAKIGLVDRVFTRIGARDDLARGNSTFMIEMLETANILNNAAERSLVILDEVGRGTATWDGMSIAWAVLEFLLYERPNTRVLFATHYHELTCLEDNKDIKNYSMAVREGNSGIAFLHQVQEGAADRSYGIEVARLAGLPLSVLKRALELLKIFEGSEVKNLNNIKPDINNNLSGQINLFEADAILDGIKELDLDNITPSQALKILEKLKDDVLKI